ncbi:hypothetical protein A3H09_03685 [Candidatus Falkowbacteria bacterium RIFCSPLOWO2_12_FULL_45_13]|uniref:Uncharacterized protein n=2 Tax=Candidatus Falkowiibacteriota TaxID=1752728 RepID=A0A1F5SBA4_9BACT|nr:MAG: hypothetical protein A3H66_03175 [Candidatus Falkowbacteria bacterium RIFCSPLOWO2_02_FULL_45_21]OGF30682.1 MAG: hypothetical protein A3H09_03685 [Candidatus Falkowbacteria bacterium RIFCSPLOWO2_12_FULL_45_13]
MLDYLKKFNRLPPELRRKVSNPTAMAAIETLEKKYRLPLAALVMRVLVKEIDLADLASYLKKENLAEVAALELARELKDKIFSSLSGYLPVGGASSMAASGPSRLKALAEVNESSSRFRPVEAGRRRDASGQPERPALKTSAQEPAVKGASFFFSVDDEAEIRELAKKIDLAARIKLPAGAVEDKLKAIINRAQINFGAADLADRFKQILKTYLRGVRNKVETKATLEKSFLSGGLSFDQASAQQVMDITDKVLNSESDEPAKPLPKIEISLPARDAPYDFFKLAGVKKAAASAAGPKSQRAPEAKSDLSLKPAGVVFRKTFQSDGTEHELAPLTPAIKPGDKKAVKPAADKKFLSPRKEIKPAAGSQGADSDQTPFVRRRFEAGNSTSGRKARVEDVKYVPKVMGPLDEIKYLGLINFRRLDNDPLRAVEKVKAEINLLAEESYGKKLEAVKGWRSSPVNRLYLDIGQKSISENKPVDVIIEERKIAGGDYLTAAEFEAIMDLNKSLRF